MLSIARGRDAQTGGGVAVDDDIGLQAAGLLVAADILELRDFAELVHEHLGPVVQFIQIAGLQGVLILRLAEPAADADVLDGLEEQGDARTTLVNSWRSRSMNSSARDFSLR